MSRENTRRITVTVDVAEYDAVLAAADAESLSMSAWLAKQARQAIRARETERAQALERIWAGRPDGDVHAVEAAREL